MKRVSRYVAAAVALWVYVAPAAVAQAPPSISDRLEMAWVENWLKAEFIDSMPIRYAVAAADLNGDERDEAILYVVVPAVCGTGGCNAIVLTPGHDGYDEVMNASVSRPPITLLPTAHLGWRDLTVTIGGGGGMTAHARMRFNGSSYPDNPTVPPAQIGTLEGELLIPEDPPLRVLGH